MNELTINESRITESLNNRLAVVNADQFTSVHVDNYDAAVVYYNHVRQTRQRADEERKNITRPIDAAKSRVMALFKPFITRLKAEEARIKSLIVSHETAVTAAAEKARREAEAKLAAERAEKEAAAKALEAKGDDFSAEVLREQQTAEFVPPPPAPKSALKKRKIWRARVTDMKSLCAAIAAGKCPIDVVSVNQSAANELAKAMKSELNIDGLEAYCEESVF